MNMVWINRVDEWFGIMLIHYKNKAQSPLLNFVDYVRIFIYIYIRAN